MKWRQKFEYRAGGFERLLEKLEELGWKIQMNSRGHDAVIKLSKGRAKGKGTWQRIDGVWTGDFSMRDRWLSDVPFDADDARRELLDELVAIDN